MKRKKYQQPVTEVVAAAPTEMIAASLLNEGEVDVIGIIDDDGGDDAPLILGL